LGAKAPIQAKLTQILQINSISFTNKLFTERS
jgi:hypothetical protein